MDSMFREKHTFSSVPNLMPCLCVHTQRYGVYKQDDRSELEQFIFFVGHWGRDPHEANSVIVVIIPAFRFILNLLH